MKIFIMMYVLSILLWSAERPIKIAPLPMVQPEQLLKEYTPMLKYLEDRTGRSFELVLYSDYATLIQKIADGSVDIAFLGPLPYVELTKKTKRIRPIVRFHDSEGKDTYTCTLFTSSKSDIKNVRSLKKRSIALTQKLSTCGYLATENILNSHGISLQDTKYHFVGSHSNVILHVGMGESDAGVAKTAIVQNYSHIGLKSIKETSPFPGFLWVASYSCDSALREQIKTIMLSLDPLKNKADADIVKNWPQDFKYGAVEAYDKDYDSVRKISEKIKIPR